jgi:folate-dependent phosphoribosylglycinamide formyltransferase PurN
MWRLRWWSPTVLLRRSWSVHEVWRARALLDPAGLKRAEYDARVTEALNGLAELVLMIGYMRIVSAAFVEAWRGRLLNVHPSLLPAFGGMMDKSVHEAVLAPACAETGCTIHQVTEDVDAGPIVLQKRCAVLPGRYCGYSEGARAGAGAGGVR